jgi:hypothetical protein
LEPEPVLSGFTDTSSTRWRFFGTTTDFVRRRFVCCASIDERDRRVRETDFVSLFTLELSIVFLVSFFELLPPAPRVARSDFETVFLFALVSTTLSSSSWLSSSISLSLCSFREGFRLPALLDVSTRSTDCVRERVR